MYAKIENNQVSAYPYTLDNLRSDNPKVSFPQDSLSRDEIASEYGVVVVENTTAPTGKGQIAFEGTPENDNGTWKRTWSLVPKEKSQVSSDEVTKVEKPVKDGWDYNVPDIEWDGSQWIEVWTGRERSWSENRLEAYGSAENQIEYIVENGLDSWKSKVDEIKAKYPKS